MLHGDLFLPETLIVSGFAAPGSRFLKAPGDTVPVVFDYRERDRLYRKCGGDDPAGTLRKGGKSGSSLGQRCEQMHEVRNQVFEL